jgi:hypothetical protein
VTIQELFDGSDKISGTVASASDGWQCAMTGNRAVFASTNAVNYRGRYTMLIPGFVDASAGPGGDGYVVLTIANNGLVTASGALGDGVAITAQGATVSRDGDWPLYCTAYVSSFNTGSKIVQTHNGSLQGWIHFTNNTANATFTGQLVWNKSSWTNGFYNSGFSLAVNAAGSVYKAPTISGVRSLFLTNAMVTFTGGNLAAALSDSVTVSDANAITFLTANTKSKLTFTPSNGRITGVFSNAVTSTHRSVINGIYLQSTNFNYVGGYFRGTSQTGLFEMQ